MDHRDIPVLTHSSPARRSSDLAAVPGGDGRAAGPASLARCQVRPEGPMLRLENLQKRYRTGDLALKGVDLSVPDGQIMALIGPSGAGKSTLIRCINRLVEPTGGKEIGRASCRERVCKYV